MKKIQEIDNFNHIIQLEQIKREIEYEFHLVCSKYALKELPEKLNVLDCLGFVKGNCCPHYDEEHERRPSLFKFIKDKELSNCYAVEGGCALHIKNDNVYSAISFQGKKNSYYVNLEDENIKETICPVKQIT